MSSYKLKVRTQLPASLIGGTGITVIKNGLNYTVGINYSKLGILNAFDPNVYEVLLQSSLDGSFIISSISSLVSSSQTQQVKVSAGDVTVANNDYAIAVNKTVGAATNVNFPLAANKIRDCLVADLKGDAGTNNITINPTSPETIMGQASYVIAANNGSVRLVPIPGVGYIL